MRTYIKNLIPTFAVTLACCTSGFAAPLILLSAIPQSFGAMTGTEILTKLGWQGIRDMVQLGLVISVPVSAWVAAMSPFTHHKGFDTRTGEMVIWDD